MQNLVTKTKGTSICIRKKELISNLTAVSFYVVEFTCQVLKYMKLLKMLSDEKIQFFKILKNFMHEIHIHLISR